MFGVEDRSIVNIFIKEIGDGIVRDFVQDDFVMRVKFQFMSVR